MALSAAQVTFNAAVDTLYAAWVTYCDTLTKKDVIHVVFPSITPGSTGTSSDAGMFNAATFPEYDPTQGVDMITFEDLTIAASTRYPHEANGKNLFWKLTNAAGDTAGA